MDITYRTGFDGDSADDDESASKKISPAAHAVLDYATAAAFFALAARYRHHNDRASTLALINGLSVLVLSIFTDYPGGLFRRISFRTHRAVDAAQAALAGAGPALLGFAGDADARAFYAQAATEAGVIGATDWDAVERRWDTAQLQA